MARLQRSGIAERQLSSEPAGAVIPADLMTRVPLSKASLAGKMADLLQERSQRMQEQRDVMDAINARNEYRDRLRDLKTESFANSRGGLANQDLYKRHLEDSEKFRLDISNRLTKGAQQRFVQLSQSDQDSHLDQISNFVIRETENYKADTLKGSIVSANDKIMGDVNAYEKERDLVFAEIDTLNPGMDNRAAKSEINRQLLSTKIETMIDSDPAIAKDFLEKNKAEIGNEIYFKYSKFLDKQIAVRLKEIEQQALNDEAQVKSDAVNQVYGFMRNGEMVKALKFINNNDNLDEEEKYKFEQALEYKMKTGKDPFDESNPAYVSMMLKKASNGEFTEDEINRLIPIAGRLSRQDANMIKNIAGEVLKGSSNGYTQKLRMAMSSIEKQITRDNTIIKGVPEVVEWNYKAQNEMLDTLNSEPDQSKRMEMLNPRSEKYIIPKIISPYMGKSLDEQIKIKMKQFNAATGEEPEEKPGFFTFERWLGKKEKPAQPAMEQDKQILNAKYANVPIGTRKKKNNVIWLKTETGWQIQNQ